RPSGCTTPRDFWPAKRDEPTFERASPRPGRSIDIVDALENNSGMRLSQGSIQEHEAPLMAADTVEVGATAPVQARLSPPTGVNLRRIAWPAAIWIVGYHLLALLAFMPWFFSWTGAILAIVGLYVFGSLGISLCYHRLLTHRGFCCPKWLEHTLAILGFCCLQDSPARWVAIHRRHHQHADEQPDPHSPLVNFFWGHVGWILVENQELNRLGIFERYARDILRDRFYKRLEQNLWRVWIIVLSWAVFFGGGFLAALGLGGTLMDAMQFGASLLVWGVFVRTVLVWHQTWAVNSVTHMWGYRNYATDESSRNNIFVGYFSNGEGWHNNHHADPRSAKYGHRWFELDTTYLTIRLLVLLGLARNVVLPNPRLTAASADGRVTTRGFQEVPGE
ncbi:MAG: sn stearoyl-lipid 9-desaturase, partial [Alphaproteobacteria bacterium]|nr:sn stearoyl-lipid 9-desaturase [Alphaproteobacteria bacterium]